MKLKTAIFAIAAAVLSLSGVAVARHTSAHIRFEEALEYACETGDARNCREYYDFLREGSGNPRSGSNGERRVDKRAQEEQREAQRARQEVRERKARRQEELEQAARELQQERERKRQEREAQQRAECSLCFFAERGDMAEVKRLIDGGANPDAAYDNGKTALILAKENENAEVVNMLLAAGANAKPLIEHIESEAAKKLVAAEIAAGREVAAAKRVAAGEVAAAERVAAGKVAAAERAATGKVAAAEKAADERVANAESAQTFYFLFGLFVGIGGVLAWRFRKEILEYAAKKKAGAK